MFKIICFVILWISPDLWFPCMSIPFFTFIKNNKNRSMNLCKHYFNAIVNLKIIFPQNILNFFFVDWTVLGNIARVWAVQQIAWILRKHAENPPVVRRRSNRRHLRLNAAIARRWPYKAGCINRVVMGYSSGKNVGLFSQSSVCFTIKVNFFIFSFFFEKFYFNI